jgi:streptogramin lyase
VSEIQTNNVIMIYPRTEAMRVFRLPSANAGIRSATIDTEGRYWYIGSHAGTLGVIE